MGLFDSWRRKKKRAPTTDTRFRERPQVKSGMQTDVDVTEAEPETVSSLLEKYDELVQRREALSFERENLTRKLEDGEIEATEFRKELMARIQEAAQVSENLRSTTARLAQLGYRGALH
ncbi:MAG: hypothetical protein AM326_12080 [Candidatus Thorarchaeota archaeon SMTZ-45]|nr:MAG: hypothetical protein AM326_12080 [Candidatus Thorarchaeota archaeon SMTZ-45]KXH73835.1 MAG: hypothetical protein AM325_13520 [Candidatus Thorarchaeota archaeon SMTZ1-45]